MAVYLQTITLELAKTSRHLLKATRTGYQSDFIFCLLETIYMKNMVIARVTVTHILYIWWEPEQKYFFKFIYI